MEKIEKIWNSTPTKVQVSIEVTILFVIVYGFGT